jgi:nucleoside-diphosphate-sugar epimerase
MFSTLYSSNFLLLGHRGFIGTEIQAYFAKTGSNYSTISERLLGSNIESLISANVTDKTIVINCIASGVTPGTGNFEIDLQTNFELVQRLCDDSLSSGADGFIHLASNYELPRHIQPLASRTPYISTKSKGSEYCLQQIHLGKRVKLAYLPTVIGLNQPQGRFFRDFIEHLRERKPFQLNYPAAEVELVTVPSLFKQLDLTNLSAGWGVQEVLEDLRLTVLDFAELLNDILEELGADKLKLRDANLAPLSKPDEGTKIIQSEFRNFLVSQLSQVLGGLNA